MSVTEMAARTYLYNVLTLTTSLPTNQIPICYLLHYFVTLQVQMHIANAHCRCTYSVHLQCAHARICLCEGTVWPLDDFCSLYAPYMNPPMLFERAGGIPEYWNSIQRPAGVRLRGTWANVLGTQTVLMTVVRSPWILSSLSHKK